MTASNKEKFADFILRSMGEKYSDQEACIVTVIKTGGGYIYVWENFEWHHSYRSPEWMNMVPA